MLPCNLYTSRASSGFALDVAAPQLSAALQLQQHYSNTPAPISLAMEAKYPIDVPISASDVDRWGMSMVNILRHSPAAATVGLSEETLEGASSSQSSSSLLSVASPLPSQSVPFFLPGEVLAMGTPAQQREAVHPLAPVPSFDANAKSETSKSISQVLQHRREWLPHRQRFPVYQQRMEVLDALCQHLVVALVGGPESGKTLQLPQVLSESGAFKRTRILMVVPNEIAVHLAAWRLREELGDANASASAVGYVSCLEVCCDAHTRIVVLTADVLLRQLLCDPTLVGVRAVIIDDLHLRSERTELCLGLLRELLVELAAQRVMSGLPPASSSISSLRLIVNCVDTNSAKQITEYFSVVPCSIFPLHPVSSSSDLMSLFSGGHRGAKPAVGPNPVIFYLDEAVQWLNKCASEERSSICQLPEEDLVSYMGKVEVATQIMAASEADFLDEVKCRQYWCGLMKDALFHFDMAEKQWMHEQEDYRNMQSSPLLSVIVVSIPETEHAIRIVEEELQKFIFHSTQNKPEGERDIGDRIFKLHNLFSSEDMASSLYNDILPTLANSFSHPSVTEESSSSSTLSTRHILLGPSELLESLLPPNLNVGLIIDFARQCTCLFNIETAADQWSTEYVSSTVLQHRRRVAFSTRHCLFHNDGYPVAQENNAGRQSASLPASILRPPPLVIHLIPKSLLHSSQRRRQHHDAGHHSVFRLSSTQYLHLYQMLQLREDITTAAAFRRGVVNFPFFENSSGMGRLGNSRISTTITERIGTVFSQYFMGVPAPTSNKYEQLKRVFQQLEMYLRASGHLLPAAKSMMIPATPLPASWSAAFVQPLGILTTCWLFPIPVTRVLIFGAILQRPLEATAVAAIWLGGDAFEAHIRKLRQKGDSVALSTSEAIVLEARKFFGRDNSDISALFFLYKMWLDQRNGGPEEEEAFISECQADRATLVRIHRYHGQLLLFLRRNGLVKWTSLGISGIPFSHNGHNDHELLLEQVAKRIIELPDSAFMEDPVQMVISAAVYPHYGVPNTSGAVRLYEGLNLSGTRTQRAGVFSKSCIMHQKEILQKLHETPVTFLSRLMITGLREQQHLSSAVSTTPVSLLQQGWMLHCPGSFVFCGEEKEKPLDVPSRCRGWSSVLTSSWRKTRRAQILPPAAKLPPISIALQSFDMTSSKQVLVSVDGQLQFVMRATVAQWLRQLRWFIQRYLRLVVSNPCTGISVDELLDAFHSQQEEVVEAWSWWCRRKANSVEWLREERQKYANIRKTTVSMEEEEEHHGGGGGGAGAVHRLYPFYAFQTEPGIPPLVQPPQQKQHATATAGGEYEADGRATEGSHQEQDVYTGKLPSADMDSVIRYCVTAIAESGSRKAENKLLKDNPDTFSFLEPSNELHEYYLFLLKKAAPNIETLGDDIEALIAFLKELEAELREEQGLPPLEEVAANTAEGQPQNEGEAETSEVLRVEDVENDEDEDGFKGIQEEEAFSLRKNIVARGIHHPIEHPTSIAKKTSPLLEYSSLSSGMLSGLPSAGGLPFDPTEAPGTESPDHALNATGTFNESTSPNFSTLPSSQVDGLSDPSRIKELLSLIDGPLGMGPFTVMDTNESPTMLPKPTASELAALLDGPEDGQGLHAEEPEATELALRRPPPPLPAAMVEGNVPSVLVYPVPYSTSCKRAAVPNELCRALEKQLALKVGPAIIVGKIARITVPNKKVERRCLLLGSFHCFGELVYLFRNDRIIDNPQKEAIKPTPPTFPPPMGAPGVLLPPQHGGIPYLPSQPSTANPMMPPPPFMQQGPPPSYPPMFSTAPGMGFHYAPPPHSFSGTPYMVPHPSMMQSPYGYFPKNNAIGLPPAGSGPHGAAPLPLPFPTTQPSLFPGGNFPPAIPQQPPTSMNTAAPGSIPFPPTKEESSLGSQHPRQNLGRAETSGFSTEEVSGRSDSNDGSDP